MLAELLVAVVTRVPGLPGGAAAAVAEAEASASAAEEVKVTKCIYLNFGRS